MVSRRNLTCKIDGCLGLDPFFLAGCVTTVGKKRSIPQILSNHNYL